MRTIHIQWVRAGHFKKYILWAQVTGGSLDEPIDLSPSDQSTKRTSGVARNMIKYLSGGDQEPSEDQMLVCRHMLNALPACGKFEVSEDALRSYLLVEKSKAVQCSG